MKVLVVGAAGQVGRCLALQAAAEGNEVVAAYNTRPLHLPGATVTRIDKVDANLARSAIRDARPGCVIDTGALHNVDYCESHPEEAFRVNRDGTRNLAVAAAEVDAQFVFVSTDFVFDGRKQGLYVEADRPNPESQYAASKLAGEEAALAASPRNLVVRPSVIYSWLDSRSRVDSSSGKGTNFGTWLVDEVAQGRSVRIIQDQVASPTLAEDLAAAILALVNSSTSGTYHAAGSTPIDRYDFSVQLVTRVGLDPSLVRPIRTADLNQKARRPPNSSLDSARLASATGHRMLSLREAIERFSLAWADDPGARRRS